MQNRWIVGFQWKAEKDLQTYGSNCKLLHASVLLTGVVICLERRANDLRMVQLMPLPPHHLLLQQNLEWFILMVAAYPGCPEKKDIKRLCVCVRVLSTGF